MRVRRRTTRPGKGRRLLAALLVAVLSGTLAGQLPTGAAAAAAELPAPKDVKGVKVQPVTVTPRPEWTAGERELTEADLPDDEPEVPEDVQTVEVQPVPAVSAGSAAKVAAKGVQAGDLPVFVAPGPRSAEQGAAAQAAEEPVRKARVQVLDTASSAQAGVAGMVVKLSRADGVARAAPARVTVDYQSLRDDLGQDAMTRLRLVSLKDGRPISAVRDPKAHTLSATVSLGAGITALAVAAAPEGENGDYKATKLTPASTWQVSKQTGAFSWSYPITVPAAPAGLTPELSLAYSSASIDGRTSGTNTQGSEVGDGWDMAAGFIERSYRTCSDDRDEKEKKDPNNADVLGGDLCWFNDNATMSFKGSSTELVPVASDGEDGKRVQYRGVSDDGSRIELIKDDTVDNGDEDKSYWRVTTIDGVQYFFGRNKIVGGSSAGTSPDSVLTAPVYGNHPGEPGYQKEFAKSRATRAWRWNLDYVVDPSGNTISYFYDKETGAYVREGDEDKRTTYDRASVLTRIEYGSRADAAESVRPADRVVFDYQNRCVGTCFKANGKPIKKRWPDTPWDQYCDNAPCKTQYSPTFWTQKRLDKINTQVYAGTGDDYTDVDSWQLKQTYLQAGGNESTPMWLKGITRTGLVTSGGGSAVTFPEVVFNPNADVMPNRVDTPNGHSSLFRNRIDTITTESGAQIGVTYSKPECDGKALPKPWDNNQRCYPQYYGAEGEKAKLDWFNKYVVTRLDVYDNTGGFEHQQTNYDYLDLPAWGYDNSALTKPKKRTWGQFRGYGRVRVRQGVESGVQSATDYTFFRGMNGDKQPKTDELPPTGTPRREEVTDSQGTKVDDHPAFAGMVREQTTYNGVGGEWLSGTINTPVIKSQTASSDGLTAYRTYTDTVRTRTRLSAGRTRWTQTVTDVNDDALPTAVTDLGEITADGKDIDPNDNRCDRTAYVRNGSAWILNRIQQAKTLAVGCDVKNPSNDKVLSDTRTYYDDPDTFGAAPTRGLPVRVEQLSSWNGSTPVYVRVNRTTYDANGRPVSETDAGDRATTTTTYTPKLAGPVTAIKTTIRSVKTDTVLQEASKTLDRSLGLPVNAVDANGGLTELAYDGAGRLIRMWSPGRDRKTFPDHPSMMVSYQVRKTAPSAVTTSTLTASGTKTYRTVVTLHDGLLRERQKQTQTVSGGRSITDSVYDSRGQVAWTSNAYYDMENGAPDTTLVTTRGRPEIPALTQNVYDGAGRITDAVFLVNGDEKWRTHTDYNGERTSLVPPNGGIATTTIEDARGRKAQLRQYQDPKLVGRDDAAFDTITYGYTDRDELVSVVSKPIGATAATTWSYGYDLRGNKDETKDPDNGVSASHYDAANLLEWTRDGRGKVLYYDYDELGRKVAQRQGAKAGPVMVRWEYDTLPNGKGRLSRATRYEPAGSTNGYVTAVTGYDQAGKPTGTATTVPSAETGMCVSGEADPCTYTQSTTYRANGAVDKVKYPATAGLPAETVTSLYNKVGLADGVYGKQIYVQEVVYNQLDQLIGKNLGEHGTRIGLAYGFDEATGRQKTFSAVGELKSEIYDLSYTYDDAGSIKSIKDVPDDGQPADTQCFDYDHLRRLTEAWTPNSGSCDVKPGPAVVMGGAAPYWRSYGYDAAGNRKAETIHGVTNAGDTTRTYGYPAAGGGAGSRPHAVNKVTSAGATNVTQQYGYDTAGNMTCRPGGVAVANACNADGTAGAGSQALAWNDEGKLAKTTDKSGETSYVYDADGNRLIRRDPAGATLYLPGGTEIRKPKTSAATGTRFYTHGGAVVAVRTAKGLTWQVNDHQATGTASVTSGKDLTVTRRRTLPFGETRGAKPAEWAGEKGFVGGTMDNTGLIHLGAREYDAGLGRFVSVDILMNLDDPQQWNAYNYANDTPLTLSDPTGLCGIWGPGDIYCNPKPDSGGGTGEDDKGDETGGDGKGNKGDSAGNGGGKGNQKRTVKDVVTQVLNVYAELAGYQDYGALMQGMCDRALDEQKCAALRIALDKGLKELGGKPFDCSVFPDPQGCEKNLLDGVNHIEVAVGFCDIVCADIEFQGGVAQLVVGPGTLGAGVAVTYQSALVDEQNPVTFELCGAVTVGVCGGGVVTQDPDTTDFRGFGWSAGWSAGEGQIKPVIGYNAASYDFRSMEWDGPSNPIPADVNDRISRMCPQLWWC